MGSRVINWRISAVSVLVGVGALGGLNACTADRSGTIVSTKPAASIKVDNCSPIAGATTVSWSGFTASVASVQVLYTRGTAKSTSAWTNAASAATSGSVKVSAPTSSVTGGTWAVSGVVTATSKNGGGTKTTVTVSCSPTSSSSATPVTIWV